jgi:hypothetical protein
MNTRYKTSRDLSLRLKAGATIYHSNKLTDIRRCKYTGVHNKVIYKDTVMSIHAFCVKHRKENAPNLSQCRNAWYYAYVKRKRVTSNGAIVNKYHCKLKNIPLLQIPNTNTNTDNNLNNTLNNNNNQTNILNMPEKTTKTTKTKAIKKAKATNPTKATKPTKAKSAKATNPTKAKSAKAIKKIKTTKSTKATKSIKATKATKSTKAKTKTKVVDTVVDGDTVVDVVVEPEPEPRVLEPWEIRGRKLDEWWNTTHKEKITDPNEYTSVMFAIRKIKGTNDYAMLNQNKLQIGAIIPWVDKENEYPDRFKNKENVIIPMGTVAYEYILNEKSPYHEMPRTRYYNYTFNTVLNKFLPNENISVVTV